MRNYTGFSKILGSVFWSCAHSVKKALVRPSSFMPKVFTAVEVRAVCRSLEYLHTKLIKPCHYVSLFAQGNCHVGAGKSFPPNCCHKLGSIQLLNTSLYAVALTFPHIETYGPMKNPEKQPQNIFPLPPNITIGPLGSGG